MVWETIGVSSKGDYQFDYTRYPKSQTQKDHFRFWKKSWVSIFDKLVTYNAWTGVIKFLYFTELK